jgi:methylase of polypeptide subunit release factors
VSIFSETPLYNAYFLKEKSFPVLKMVTYKKTELREITLGKHNLSLEVSPSDLFLPNVTTVRFARAVDTKLIKGATVFDIGTGVGPLAIYAALEGADHVYGVDPVAEHIEIARRNARRCKLSDKVTFYVGEFFSPLEELGLKADVIIGDVSGIAEKAARALGWYPPNVPTGGEDGTEVIAELLRQSPPFLNQGGTLYFPIARDLSDEQKLMKIVKNLYDSVIEASPEVRFPLTEDQLTALYDSYNGNLPPFIQIQERRGNTHLWRGQIYAASKPRLEQILK